jgi:hypothetical protein
MHQTGVKHMTTTLSRILLAAANSLEQGKRKACNSGGADAARREIETIDSCAKYGEPGYHNPAYGIVFANWNYFPRELGAILERAGYAVEWSDEWVIDYESDKAYRTLPNGHGWLPYYVEIDDGIVGGDVIESGGDHTRWYVEEWLRNNPQRANHFTINLASFGFCLVSEHETGFHPGQTDDPRKIFARLREQNPDCDVVFSIHSKGQFDTAWQAWIREGSTKTELLP